METNASFQSLFQLAVAVNLGFIAITTVFGNAIAREKNKIEFLFNAAKTLRDETITRGVSVEYGAELFLDCVKLREEVHKEVNELEELAFSTVRPIAITCAIIALLLLVYSSIHANNLASPLTKFASVATIIPFVFFVIKSIVKASAAAKELKIKRYKLEEKVGEALLNALNK